MEGKKSLGPSYRRVIILYSSIGKTTQRKNKTNAADECIVVSKLTQMKSFTNEKGEGTGTWDSSTKSLKKIHKSQLGTLSTLT